MIGHLLAGRCGVPFTLLRDFGGPALCSAHGTAIVGPTNGLTKDFCVSPKLKLTTNNFEWNAVIAGSLYLGEIIELFKTSSTHYLLGMEVYVVVGCRNRAEIMGAVVRIDKL